MATAGPSFPTVGASAVGGRANEVPWTTPTGITASGGTTAQCIAATFDTPDPTEELTASGFGFAIPAGSTINTIIVTVNRRSIIAGSARDLSVKLRSEAGAPTGASNSLATTWPSALTSQAYSHAPTGAGGTWQLQASGYTTDAQLVALVNHANFGVVLVGQALIANADIEVDYITIAIDYTPVTGIDHAQPVADTLTLADSATTQSGKSAAPADTLTLSDSLSSAAVLQRSVPDTLTLADSLASARTYERTIPDTLSVADSTTAQRAIAQAIDDSLALADATSFAATLERVVDDTLSVADEATPALDVAGAISPVGTFTRTTFASTLSPTINAPGGGIADGDLIVIVVVTNSTCVFDTTPANGFTLLNGASQNAGADSTTGVLWKIASGEGASWTFANLFSEAELGSAWVTVWDDAHPTTPIVDSEAESASDTSGTTQAGPSITSTVANSVVVQVVGCDPPVGAFTTTPDASPAATELIDDKPDDNAYCFLQYSALASPGALALDSTISAGANLAVFQFAIRPAGVAGTAWEQPVDDTLSVVDALASSAVYGRTLSDSLTLADLLAMAGVFQLGLGDTLTLADSLTTSGAGAQAIADTLALSDSLSSASVIQRTVSDTLSLADTLSTQAVLLRSLADTVTLADLADPVKTTGGVAHEQPVADTLSVADSLASQAVLLRTLAEALALEDAASTQAVLLRAIADTLGVADLLVSELETIVEGFAGVFDPETERGRVSDSERSDEYGVVLVGRSRSRSTSGTYTSVQSGKIGVE